MTHAAKETIIDNALMTIGYMQHPSFAQDIHPAKKIKDEADATSKDQPVS